MERIKFDLKYCHGIDSLDCELDFTNTNAVNIYAPNGTMKTSLTKTLLDLKEGRESKDNIYTNRDSRRIITKSDGKSLDPKDIVIVESFKEDYESDKITNLLASSVLKKEYDEINKSINAKKNEFLKKLSKVSGIQLKNVEGQFTYDFKGNHKKFFDVLNELEQYSVSIPDYDLSNLVYKNIINDKVSAFLANKDVKSLLGDYINKYNELVERSVFFKKGIFNHSNASNVGKSLQDNGFFQADYKVILGEDESSVIINSQKDLNELIYNEKEKILNDDDLKTKFDNIDRQIRNKELNELRRILEGNPEFIIELDDYNLLKKKIWISYIFNNEEIIDLYRILIKEYNSSKEKIENILKKAREEKTKWDDVLRIFNNRFDVPFIVTVENQEDVILKQSTPTLVFTHKDTISSDERVLDKNKLMNILSKGEQRALYLLNIIFEIEAIKEDGRESIIVFDDIADSFDYKNKYAIIEYLKDIKESKKTNGVNIFKMIILTHNFDFYRTVGTRLGITESSKMAYKTEDEIILTNGKYFYNIFKIWKNRLNQDDKYLIASIPFVRNLCEYIDTKDSNNFRDLTQLLHIKENTLTMTVGDIETIYSDIWKTKKDFRGKERKVKDIIFEQAEKIIQNKIKDEIILENKIILSIAIRLYAEMYMIQKINDKDAIKKINRDQTSELFNILRNELDLNRDEDKHIFELLGKVVLMTPENIHINSFMYEPLLDISDQHLRKLYEEIKKIYLYIKNEELSYSETALTLQENV